MALDNSYFASSTSATAISVKAGSILNAKNNIFGDLKYGIVLEGKPVLMFNFFDTVFAEGYGMTIKNNIFESISSHALNNKRYDDGAVLVDARENWWGSENGPSVDEYENDTGGTRAAGLVDISNWLKKRPEGVHKIVMFIPGIQASRLHTKTDGELNKRWEPISNNDVKALFMDSDGLSKDRTVIAKEIIDEAFSFNVYKSLIEYLDNLKKENKISEWVSYPYDWRNSIEDISDSIFTKIKDVIEKDSSVSIDLIGHSNGGLITKLVINKLVKAGLSNNINNEIFVAVPELGAPKVVGSLLHGDGQELAKGLILNKETAKGFSEYMPGAFGLIPSDKYFENASETESQIISFKNTKDFSFIPKAYGAEITTYDNLKSYMNGEDGTRIKPSLSDDQKPNVLKTNFINNSSEIHNTIDPLDKTFENSYNIIGYGLATPSGINYEGEKEAVCVKSYCTFVNNLARSWKFTDGDGTVPITSAEYNTGGKYYFNLKEYNKSGLLGSNINRSHGDILEIPDILKLLGDIILLGHIDTESKFISQIRSAEEGSMIKVKTHSPVNLYVKDSDGRVVSMEKLPDGNTKVVNEIPNAVIDDAGSFGMILPAQNINIDVKGNDDGYFGLSIEKLNKNMITVSSSSFMNIPVSTTIVATVSLSQSNVASTTMSLYFNSDKISDLVIPSGTDFIKEKSRKNIKERIDSKKKDRFRSEKFFKWIEKKMDKIEEMEKADKMLEYNHAKEVHKK